MLSGFINNVSTVANILFETIVILKISENIIDELFNHFLIMKKNLKTILVIAVLLISGVLSSNAQELGVRIGGTNGAGGAALDAVFSSGKFNRIHADLGFYNGGVGIDAYWDFINRPLDGEALNWYLGVGPTTYVGKKFWLGVSSEIGLEYRFRGVPVAIGADWRPTLWVVEETHFGANSFGLNVRFVFGN